MGKILKYCSSCEEGFAEKFSFCPNCASELSAFEMKPVSDDKPLTEVEEVEEAVAETPEADQGVNSETKEAVPALVADFGEVSDGVETVEQPEPLEEEVVFEPVAFEAEDIETDELDVSSGEDVTEIEVEEPSSKPEVIMAAAPVVAQGSVDGNESDTASFEADQVEMEQADYSYRFEDETLDDDDYSVTVIDESGGKTRNSLLLGASILVLTVSLGALGYSLFNHPLFIAAIDGDISLLAPVEIGPVEIEEKQPEKQNNDDDDGGGGGGGNDRKVPPSKGQLPDQTRDPILHPPIPMEQANTDLQVVNKTEGDNKRERTDRTGLPTGLTGATSSGTGTGGGIGTGRGTGVGSGIGTGEGSGIGSGSGSGRGNGNGRGRGRGGQKPPKVKGPSVPMRILVKPRPGYTDKARQNNVQGVVMLRVLFLSSGRIGRISSVKGLPHGLTAKAIAAARRIRFKPQLINGVPQSVTKRIQYSFTIY